MPTPRTRSMKRGANGIVFSIDSQSQTGRSGGTRSCRSPEQSRGGMKRAHMLRFATRRRYAICLCFRCPSELSGAPLDRALRMAAAFREIRPNPFLEASFSKAARCAQPGAVSPEAISACASARRASNSSGTNPVFLVSATISRRLLTASILSTRLADAARTLAAVVAKMNSLSRLVLCPGVAVAWSNIFLES